MEVRFFCKSSVGPTIYDDHELKLGGYNEYYLPAIHGKAEAWVIITDDNGTETKLHLKR